ncbi:MULTISPECIES: hypothetical protein [Tatumella]|uniref:Uncharacterized protein n=2 Tax=Tatumella ptyseos TaxID=82987 RepID=A0A085JQF5_9GAMM|nr:MULTISPECIES: hypothetical protein [Tatumella]KFD22701.1 hypothetical protein GTPT_0280 [Tatumella ptyseos ATCC 33301]SQK71940.1 Uncharacterised protein [Tatumella ptyseos]
MLDFVSVSDLRKKWLAEKCRVYSAVMMLAINHAGINVQLFVFSPKQNVVAPCGGFVWLVK